MKVEFEMVFSSDDKAIIKHYYEDKGLNSYQIWRNNPEKKWDKRSVARLVSRYKERKTMDRKPKYQYQCVILTSDY